MCQKYLLVRSLDKQEASHRRIYYIYISDQQQQDNHPFVFGDMGVWKIQLASGHYLQTVEYTLQPVPVQSLKTTAITKHSQHIWFTKQTGNRDKEPNTRFG